MFERITTKRACEAIEIPSGLKISLPEGTFVRITQSRGDSYTVTTEYGQMYRIDAKDSDVLGLAATQQAPTEHHEAFSEKLVWDQLKTVYDPEIPVNIVDLGLIYSCDITPAPEGGKKIDIKMSMTAPGCGMGHVIKADVENKISRLPEVKSVHAEVVFEPAWNPSRMSEAAKLQLGFDLDYDAASNASGGYR